LAAASSRISGVLLARQPAAAATSLEDDLDPSGQWLEKRAPSFRRGPWSFAVATALAASLVAAVLLTRGDAPGPAPVAAVADANNRVGAVAMVSPAANPVQVESVDYSGRSLAMWTEPESDTTVIWVEDEDSGAAPK